MVTYNGEKPKKVWNFGTRVSVMQQKPLPKPSFDEFIQSCTPLLKIPELEAQMRERVRSIVKELLDFQPNADPAKNLKQFIQKDENFLGVLLALTNLSQEKFLRILTAQRFTAKDFGTEWGGGCLS